MQTETFKLRAAANQESLNYAAQMLKSLAGVSNVTPSLLRNELSVEFDAKVASKPFLRAALANAGYEVEAGNPTGGCGGGGGGCGCGG